MTEKPKDAKTLDPDGLRPLRDKLLTVAVTGTNGKTSIATMLSAIAAAAGEVPARVTTLGMWVGTKCVTEARDLASFRRATELAVEAGARTLALETTSTSLQGGFAELWPPDVAVFSNLSRDHLDRHGSAEAYLAAKARLFLALPRGGSAVLNLCDPASALIRDILPSGVRVVGYGLQEPHPDCAGIEPVLTANELRVNRKGTRVVLDATAVGAELEVLQLRIVGRVLAFNALAAAAAASCARYAASEIRAGLKG